MKASLRIECIESIESSSIFIRYKGDTMPLVVQRALAKKNAAPMRALVLKNTSLKKKLAKTK